MASLDDIATIQKNGVVGINALTAALQAFKTIYESYVGTKSFLGATSDTLVATGPGRLVNVTVVVAGSAAGTIHDAASVANAGTGNVIAITPTTAGMMPVNFPYTNGLVVKPGTGQTISLTYS